MKKTEYIPYYHKGFEILSYPDDYVNAIGRPLFIRILQIPNYLADYIGREIGYLQEGYPFMNKEAVRLDSLPEGKSLGTFEFLYVPWHKQAYALYLYKHDFNSYILGRELKEDSLK